MSTATSSIVFNTPTANGSVVSLKPISDLLQAMVTAGRLVQTADTGQVVWGSVAANQTSTNNYEIFYLNDSLHATAPLYFKFIYATQVTANVPQCLIQIGTGSDGAGNLNGLVSATQRFRGHVNQADATSNTIWCSAGSGYLNLWGGFSSNNNTASYGGFGLSIERLRDSNGAITVDGLTVNLSGSTFSTNTAVYAQPAGTSAGSYTAAAGTGLVNGSFAVRRDLIPGLFNTTNNTYPPVTTRGNDYYSNLLFDGSNFLATGLQPYAGKLYTPGIAHLILDTNFPSLSTQTLTIYGVAHTYLTGNNNLLHLMPLNASPNAAANYVNLGCITAFLYE